MRLEHLDEEVVALHRLLVRERLCEASTLVLSDELARTDDVGREFTQVEVKSSTNVGNSNKVGREFTQVWSVQRGERVHLTKM